MIEKSEHTKLCNLIIKKIKGKRKRDIALRWRIEFIACKLTKWLMIRFLFFLSNQKVVYSLIKKKKRKEEESYRLIALRWRIELLRRIFAKWLMIRFLSFLSNQKAVFVNLFVLHIVLSFNFRVTLSIMHDIPDWEKEYII